MQKRSLTIAGHRTSIALEPEFWDGLEQMALEVDQTLPQLLAQIDKTRDNSNLSSVLRVAVLNYYRNTNVRKQD